MEQAAQSVLFGLFCLIALFVLAMMAGSFGGKEQREKVIKDAFSFNSPNVHGSASFATEADIKDAGCLKDGGIIVGETISENPDHVYFHGEQCPPHAGIFGSSGSGKSSHIVSILLSWLMSVVVFDVTGELAAITWVYRARLGRAVQFNPFGVFKDELAGLKNVRLNIIGPQFIDPARADVNSRCADIAAALVPPVDGHNKFFHDRPRGWMATLILCAAKHGKPENCNLPFIVREIINGDIRAYAKAAYRLTRDRNLRARLVDMIKEDSEEEARSFKECLATLRTETEWLLNPAIAESLSASDITAADLRRECMTLYVEAPLSIRSLVKLNKLLLGWISSELFQDEIAGGQKVLVVAEELYQYGKDLDLLPRALAASRKYLVNFLLCFTSLAEAKEMWPQGWEGLLNNLGLKIWVDASDVAGSEYVSKLLGQREVYAASKHINYPANWEVEPFCGNSATFEMDRVPGPAEMRDLKVSQSYQQTSRPLMSPLEVRELPRDQEIAFINGVGSLLLKRVPYFKTRFAKRAKRNPFWKPKGANSKTWRRW